MYQSQEEYKKGFARMMESLMPKSTEHSRESGCEGVPCKCCPLYGCCDEVGESASNAFKIMQIVWDWNQAHPVVTNRMKYKEVFGVESNRICYRGIGKCLLPDSRRCEDCKRYKDAEYHAPESVNP